MFSRIPTFNQRKIPITENTFKAQLLTRKNQANKFFPALFYFLLFSFFLSFSFTLFPSYHTHQHIMSEFRRNNFKKVADLGDVRQKREELSLTIRKNKREDNLMKKRNLIQSQTPDNDAQQGMEDNSSMRCSIMMILLFFHFWIVVLIYLFLFHRRVSCSSHFTSTTAKGLEGL